MEQGDCQFNLAGASNTKYILNYFSFYMAQLYLLLSVVGVFVSLINRVCVQLDSVQ